MSRRRWEVLDVGQGTAAQRDGFLRLSVIMPVFNEESTVEDSIARVRAVPLPIEIICVDDCSSDGTLQVLERLRDEGAIDVLLAHPRNRGKGAACRTGIEHATGDVVVIQDADLEYDPQEFVDLLEPIQDGRADAVFGSRFLGGPHRVLYFWHSVGNALLTLLSNMLTDLNLTDMETCYKMVRADLMKSLPLRANRFGFEPELTARLAQAKARVYEMPITYNGRTYAEGKKIGWRDGVAALLHILRFNLLPPRAPAYNAAGTADHAPSHRSVSALRAAPSPRGDGPAADEGRGIPARPQSSSAQASSVARAARESGS